MLNLREIISQKTNLNDVLAERNVMNTADIGTFVQQLAQHVNIEGAPPAFTEAVKKWFTSNFRNWLIELSPDAQRLTADQLPDEAPQWMVNGVNSADGLFHVDLNAQLVRDIANGALVYFANNTNINPQNVARISVPDMQTNMVRAQAEAELANKKEKIAKRELISEDGTEIMYDYGDGWSWRKLTTREAMKREGNTNHICVGSDGAPGDRYGSQPYVKRMQKGESSFYSLRDPMNDPKVTIEYHENSQTLGQVKGKNNTMPTEFADKIAHFVSRMRFKKVNDSGDFKRTVTEDKYFKSMDGTILVLSTLQGDIEGDIIIDETVSMDRKQRVAKETKPTKSSIDLGDGSKMSVSGDVVIHSKDMVKTYVFNTPTLIVHGDFNLIDALVKMPNAVAVGGDANWARCAMLNCPDAIRVQGDLHFPRMVKGMPTKIQVGGTLFIPKAVEGKLKPLLEDDQKISVY